MKTLLINNIGNRHLYYKNKPIDKNLFRQATLCFLNNWNKEKEYFKLNILSQALDELKKLPDKIVLFASDQGKNNIYNTQDTLFAAEIIKNILQENYAINDVEIITIDIDPSDENSLIPVYKNKLNILHHYNKDYHWQFLDAGGTPQQKLACKLLLPEIHSDTEIIYLKNVEGVNKRPLNIKKTDNIIEFFTLKNVKNLIKLGHYDSAELLLNKKNKAFNFVLLGSYRLRNIYNKNIGFRKNQKDLPVVKQFTEQISVIEFPELKDNLTPKTYFLFGEFLARADLFLQNKNYNNFVLNFQQSLEFLLIYFLLNEAEKTGLTDSKAYSDNDKVTSFINQYDKNLSKPESLPARLYTALKIAGEHYLFKTVRLLELYAKINEGYQKHHQNNELRHPGLDVLRNNLVHKGKSIDENDIKKISIIFDEILDLLNLNRNSYIDLNDFIYKHLFL